MGTLIIGGLDPGKHRDHFAVVLCELTEDAKLIIRGAKRWKGKDYLAVEAEISEIHDKFKVDKWILEINNTGTHVYEVLINQYHLPVLPVTTTKDIRDPKKRANYAVMDKNQIVRLALHWKQEGILTFPRRSTKELDELKRQLSIFAEVKTETGSVSYRAEGQEHDDLVMALMLCIHFARRKKSLPIAYSRSSSDVARSSGYGIGDDVQQWLPEFANNKNVRFDDIAVHNPGEV